MRRLILPAPPSVNHTYTRTKWGGVAKKKKAKQWEQDAMWLHKQAYPKPLGLKHFGCHIWSNVSYRRDPDNAIKICLDLLEKVGELQNDRYQADTRISRVQQMPVDIAPEVPDNHICLTWWDWNERI